MATGQKNLPKFEGLVILIGAPASGKSTFASELINEGKLAVKSYISNDAIAIEMFNVNVDRGEHDGAIFEEQDRRIAELLINEKVALVDATNVRPEARSRLIAIANKYNQPVMALCFREDSSVLLERNREREVKVPEEMLLEYASLMGDVTRELLEQEGIQTTIEI